MKHVMVAISLVVRLVDCPPAKFKRRSTSRIFWHLTN